MPVRKISSEVRLNHLVYSPSSGGCLYWIMTGKTTPPAPEPGPPRGPIEARVGSSWWRTSKEYTYSQFLDFTVHAPNARVLLNTEERGKLVRFHSDWFWADSDLTQTEIDAVLKARVIRKKQTVERAKSLAALKEVPKKPVARGAIPEDLKILVWTRDAGSCAKCGSKTELQFDHIIPVALGGATTEQNLQVLCGPCNRAKGASVS